MSCRSRWTRLAATLIPLLLYLSPLGVGSIHNVYRLAYNDDAGPCSPSNDDEQLLGLAPTAHLTYRFIKAGRYVVAVGAFGEWRTGLQLLSKGFRSSWSEKLPLASAQSSAHPEASGWREREFARKIEPDHLQELWARTVRVSQRKDAPLTPGNDSERPVRGADKKTGAQAALDPATPSQSLALHGKWNEQPARGRVDSGGSSHP